MITAIKQQVKRADRFSIFGDGKYLFSLSEAEVVQLGIREGQEITTQDLAKLKDEATLSKAYDRAVRYVSIRPRSEHEITSYLGRKSYEEEIISTVVEKLYRLRLLDDADFARQWLEWRMRSGSSKRKIQAELIQKRVDREIIKEVLDAIDPNDELEQVKELIERKTKLSQYQDKQKLMAFLARRGYSYDLIKKAFTEAE